jgi:hypothetical protein
MDAHSCTPELSTGQAAGVGMLYEVAYPLLGLCFLTHTVAQYCNIP